MTQQNQEPHRINEEEYQKELQQAEKSNNPEVQTTDYSVINMNTGKIDSIHTGYKDLEGTLGQDTDAGTGTGAGIGIGTAAQGSASTEADMKNTGLDPDTRLGTPEYPVPMNKQSNEQRIGSGTDQFIHGGESRSSADTEE